MTTKSDEKPKCRICGERGFTNRAGELPLCPQHIQEMYDWLRAKTSGAKVVVTTKPDLPGTLADRVRASIDAEVCRYLNAAADRALAAVRAGTAEALTRESFTVLQTQLDPSTDVAFAIERIRRLEFPLAHRTDLPQHEREISAESLAALDLGIAQVKAGQTVKLYGEDADLAGLQEASDAALESLDRTTNPKRRT